MTAIKNNQARVDQLVKWYGEGADGSSPTHDQWARIVGRPEDQPITLINFFKMRDLALYSDNEQSSVSGQEAFERYAAVSMPTLEKVGGSFLLVAPFEGMFAGAPEDWDLVAIGSYPNTAALLNLFEDEAYRSVFNHRVAACERQRVFVCSG